MKKVLITFISIFMIFTLGTVSVSAGKIIQPKNIYVSNVGDDSNDGSESNPYQTIQKAVEVANDYDTVILLSDIVTETRITVTKFINIDLNEKTLTHDDSNSLNLKNDEYAIVYDGYDYLPDHSVSISGKVYNGTIISTTIGLYAADHANVTAENLTVVQTSGKETCDFIYTAVAASYGSTLTINSGSYTGDNAVGVFSTGGFININGGTFTARKHGYVLEAYVPTSNESESDTVINVNDGKLIGKFKLHTETGYDGKTASIVIKGGIYDNFVEESYIWDDTSIDYTCVANSDSSTNTTYLYAIGMKGSDYPSEVNQVDNETKSNSSVNSNNKQDLQTAISKNSIDLKYEALSLFENNPIPQNIRDEKDNSSISDGIIEVVAYLEQEITEIKDNEQSTDRIDSFKVDITPKYYVRIVNEDRTQHEDVPNTKATLSVNRKVQIKVYLPTEFVPSDVQVGSTRVYVKHKGNVYGLDGNEIYIQSEGTGVDTKYFIEFYNPDGFSEFEFSLKELTPDPKPTKKTSYKDESCEAVIGKDWTWDNDLGVCKLKGYRIVNTETK